MNLGKAIKEIRKSKGLSQTELSISCGVSVNAISNIELDNVMPRKETLKKICTSLCVPVSYVLFSCIDEEDIPDGKREVFKALGGIKDLLIR